VKLFFSGMIVFLYCVIGSGNLIFWVFVKISGAGKNFLKSSLILVVLSVPKNQI